MAAINRLALVGRVHVVQAEGTLVAKERVQVADHVAWSEGTFRIRGLPKELFGKSREPGLLDPASTVTRPTMPRSGGSPR